MSRKWNIRPPKPEDLSFIYSTWLNSFYYDSWTKSIRKSVYFNNYKKVLDRLLNETVISIACLIEDDSVILGYMVSEPEIIHYVYVKEAFRKMGIAKSLAKELFDDEKGFEFTHKTRQVLPMIINKKQYVFNPILLFKQEI